MKKIYSLIDLAKKISKLRKTGKHISLSHGVFDLLHPGHIHHFDQAKNKADFLVVSITNDKNVLKGPGKPYFNEKLRLKALSSLEQIDFLVLSDEKSAVKVINNIKPNYYFKGSDYKSSKLDVTGKKIDLEIAAVKKWWKSYFYNWTSFQF